MKASGSRRRLCCFAAVVAALVALPATAHTAAPPCVVTVALSDGARMTYCQNLPIGSPQPQVTRAVIVQHGKGRDVQSYFDSMKAAAAMSGVTSKTIIIAPYFQSGSSDPSHELRWGEWAWGERSSSGFGLARRSSFEVYDELV